MNTLFPKGMKSPKRSKLENITLRNFGGGLDAVDDDISMDPRYQKILTNLRRTASGSQKLRFGSNWFADLTGTATGTIVDMEYFSDHVIAVTTTGQIVAVDGDGVKTLIWSTAIAALLPGAPAGWSSGLNSIDFVPFKSQLIVHNGVDKPITISLGLAVTYLQDLATGSNVSAPIGKYGCVVSNYNCVAGITASPTLVYVSSVGTAGTFPTDPAPNDSISIDVGAYAPQGAPEIRGIAGFRSFLIVFFHAQSLVIKLGVYNDASVHTPEFPDAMPAFGILGHRCLVQVASDLMFAGLNGVNSAKRNLFSGLIDTTPLSEKISPTYRNVIGSLTDAQTLRSCFMVHDPLARDTMTHAPGGIAFTYSANEELHYRAWSSYSTPDWTCACTSFLGRVFLALGSRIFQQGNIVFADEDYFADRLNDRDKDWSAVTTFFVGDIVRDVVSSESYTCTVQHISGSVSFTQDRADQILSPKWALYEGLPITFEMELPWLDSRQPMQVKFARYASLATKGTAPFTLNIYVDNLYRDGDGNVIHTPAVSIEFIGNDAIGFGFDAGPYGGGRRSRDPRLFNVPVKFKTMKPAFTGMVKEPIEFVNLSLLYSRGRFKR